MEYFQARSDLKAIEHLKHKSMIDALVRKPPRMDLKTKWSTWHGEEVGNFRIFDDFMEIEIKGSRSVIGTREGRF